MRETRHFDSTYGKLIPQTLLHPLLPPGLLPSTLRYTCRIVRASPHSRSRGIRARCFIATSESRTWIWNVKRLHDVCGAISRCFRPYILRTCIMHEWHGRAEAHIGRNFLSGRKKERENKEERATVKAFRGESDWFFFPSASCVITENRILISFLFPRPAERFREDFYALSRCEKR